MASSTPGNGNNSWLRKVLKRMEDHVIQARRFMADSERRWERNDRRWWAAHRLLTRMVAEIRRGNRA